MNRDDPTLRVQRNYPLQFTTRALYSDMDAFRHVNNIAFSRWFEEARADLNMRAFGARAIVDPPAGSQILLASTHIDYLAPVSYPRMVEIRTAVTRLGMTSYVICHALFADADCAAIGQTVMVKALDGRPAPLSTDERAVLEFYAFGREDDQAGLQGVE